MSSPNPLGLAPQHLARAVTPRPLAAARGPAPRPGSGREDSPTGRPSFARQEHNRTDRIGNGEFRVGAEPDAIEIGVGEMPHLVARPSEPGVQTGAASLRVPPLCF